MSCNDRSIGEEYKEYVPCGNIEESYSCQIQGRCWHPTGSELGDPSNPDWSNACVALYDSDCEYTAICQFTGRCRAMHGQCVAVDQAECERSSNCVLYGACNYFEIDGYPVCHADGNCQIEFTDSGSFTCE